MLETYWYVPKYVIDHFDHLKQLKVDHNQKKCRALNTP